MSAEPPVVETFDVSKAFAMGKPFLSRGRDYLHALVRVSLEVSAGQTLGIVGESGCGKSTLAKIMVGLLAPDAGTVRFHGRDIASLSGRELRIVRTRRQMIFQDSHSSLNPRMSVGDAISEPLRVHQVVGRSETTRERGRLLSLVGLSPLIAGRLPRELSGGQRQRVSIARALSVRPEILIADEAVSSLDVSVRAQILNLLTDLRAELGLTLVFISHDLSVIDHVSDRVAVMYLGRVVELGPADAVMMRGAHPYTQGLVAAIPQPTVQRERRQPAVRGELPSPIHPPSGCVFRTRCPLAQAICAEVDPPRVVVDTNHWAACHFVTASLSTPTPEA